jgi:hypothetical protein
MAHSIPQSTNDAEPALTHDAWWELFDRLRLEQQHDYAPLGGPVAFFRAQRGADSDAL